MAATLTYSISAAFRADNATFQITPVSVSMTMDTAMVYDRITVTQASAVTLSLGLITAPIVAYFYNADDTNYITITNDAAFLAKVPAGETVLLGLVGTETLKAQANTADCIMEFAAWQAA
jgi:hypothetical protein